MTFNYKLLESFPIDRVTRDLIESSYRKEIPEAAEMKWGTAIGKLLICRIKLVGLGSLCSQMRSKIMELPICATQQRLLTSLPGKCWKSLEDTHISALIYLKIIAQSKLAHRLPAMLVAMRRHGIRIW
ncbi:hypothetical protein T265_11859 [Opisthorchis viverrini]|uniref:Uncharacterized protein n=1 Tax=Opisthorchis viverrini TaxID=6198 RepID=A0A074YXF0_OPIVI|nr:hypothetical protein T265_11856 [Opisthorchis viverrini]XP_009176920.1 hypothetical protein T265_11859 [Opisthorchis viverrini]KER19333.1 hypothetical protein T265_11856 [Opisthorchis viverrini]KER19336.1 hypothetical protein T265_11859 [Opisthorchis viverrini]